MSNLLARHGISPEQEKRMWRRQERADLLYWARLPFARKVQLLEEMEELARSMHRGKLPFAPEGEKQ